MEQQLIKKMEIKGVSKTFYNKKDYFTAIDDITFDVNEGEFLVILGPGRCGKTVLLDIIAGLENKTEGTIIYNGKEIRRLLF
jgi:ABC-type sugar transport system ATPase subunit